MTLMTKPSINVQIDNTCAVVCIGRAEQVGRRSVPSAAIVAAVESNFPGVSVYVTTGKFQRVIMSNAARRAINGASDDDVMAVVESVLRAA